MGNALAIVAALGVGCGSGVGPPPTMTAVNGSVSGTPLMIASAASVTVTDSTGGTGAMIQLASAADACGDVTARIWRANAQYLQLSVENEGTTTSAPTSLGDYRVLAFPGAAAQMIVELDDATCTPASPLPYAMRGTVTLEAIGTDYYAGTFDVTLTTGDRITGSFVPEPCPGLAATGGHTCM